MNSKILIWIIVIAIIIGGFFYFLKPSQTTQQNQSPTTKTTDAPTNTNPNQTASAQTFNILITNFTFNPNTLTINKGDTIIWTNNDSVPHQILGDSLNSPIMNTGNTFSFTFNDAGTFNYHCSIHPSMIGNIIVK